MRDKNLLKKAIVISCEHAVNTVPDDYQTLFQDKASVLETHRAIDFGSLSVARKLAKDLGCPMHHAAVTRLLIDCNRSLKHPACFSSFSRTLPQIQHRQLIEQYYLPYRQTVEAALQQAIQHNGHVLHLSIHSFTPVLNGKVRQADMGLLYDPKRLYERQFAKMWQKALQQQAPHLRIRRNYPYQGISDGFTSAMRKQFSEDVYLGLEIELNQALIADFDRLARYLVMSFRVFPKNLKKMTHIKIYL